MGDVLLYSLFLRLATIVYRLFLCSLVAFVRTGLVRLAVGPSFVFLEDAFAFVEQTFHLVAHLLGRILRLYLL